MEKSDKQKFATLIQALAAGFRTEPTPALLESYWLGLCDMDFEAIQTAVITSIRTCKFMPAASELRQAGSGVDMALAAVTAWRAVRAAVQSAGSYRSVDFGPLVNATIRLLGGWARVCNEEPDQSEVWLKKEFERLYGHLAASGGRIDGAPLKGIHELEANGKFETVVIAIEGQPAVAPERTLRLSGGGETSVVEAP